jgi:hypothetical protein
MVIQKANCQSGSNTLLLRKAMAFGTMTGLHTLQSDDLWAFWGGKKVTFQWVRENTGSGIWGPNSSWLRRCRRDNATIRQLGVQDLTTTLI